MAFGLEIVASPFLVLRPSDSCWNCTISSPVSPACQLQILGLSVPQSHESQFLIINLCWVNTCFHSLTLHPKTNKQTTKHCTVLAGNSWLSRKAGCTSLSFRGFFFLLFWNLVGQWRVTSPRAKLRYPQAYKRIMCTRKEIQSFTMRANTIAIAAANRHLGWSVHSLSFKEDDLEIACSLESS